MLTEYRRLSNELLRVKLEYNLLKQESTGLIYTPKEETILKKYDLFPKMFGKIFKDLKPSIILDSKGNSWFEFNIPKDLLHRELLYKSGGKTPKLIRRKI